MERNWKNLQFEKKINAIAIIVIKPIKSYINEMSHLKKCIWKSNFFWFFQNLGNLSRISDLFKLIQNQKKIPYHNIYIIVSILSIFHIRKISRHPLFGKKWTPTYEKFTIIWGYTTTWCIEIVQYVLLKN